MMNFWSKAGQFFTDTFVSEDKTKDEDYQKLCTKMTTIETGINNLKLILKGYNSYAQPFCQYIKTLNESVSKIYNESPLRAQITEIINRHEFIIKEIGKLGKKISKLYSKTSEWDTIFEKAKESIRTREEKRKNFDHYEQKLLKIGGGDQNKKKLKNFLARNQEKFKVASNEYIEASGKSFEIINNSIKLSWELTNPIFGELIISEKNLFEMISSNLQDFVTIINDFNDTMKRAFNPEVPKNNEETYDPKKFIRSQSLAKRKKKEYEHFFERKTNTFGNIPPERGELFINIKDKLFNVEEEK